MYEAARVLASLTCLALLGMGTQCRTASQELLPVRAGDALDLEGFDEIQGRLEAPWEFPLDVQRSGDVTEAAVIDSCRSYFELTRRGFAATPIKFQLAIGAECHALRALSVAAPSERSHLAGFLLDEALPLLPVDLAVVISNDQARRVAEARERGLSWSDLEPRLEAVHEGDQVLRIDGPGFSVRLTVYGFGDFDVDGQEDVLLRSDAWLDEGTWATTRLLALTRSPDDTKLRMVREFDLTE